MDDDGALERPRVPRVPEPPWRRSVAVLAVLAIVVAIAAIVWFELLPAAWLERAASPAPALQPAPNAAADNNAAREKNAELAAREALPETQAKLEPTAPLPALDKSDEVLQNLVSYLVGPGAFGKLFYPNELVHRFVATVDNLPRQQLPRRLSPLKPVEGQFLAAATGSAPGAVIRTANFDRYRPYVLALEAIDTKQLVAGYTRFYPWFQDDYRALGYPSGAFNERLLAAIDDLLSTPEVEEPLALTQPKVLYQFADGNLEALPAGQKILLRVGPHYAARIKAKLRDIRRELAQSSINLQPR